MSSATENRRLCPLLALRETNTIKAIFEFQNVSQLICNQIELRVHIPVLDFG